MLTERIMGAFTFRKGIYAEVERDASFTSTAWILVAVVAFLNQLGANASGEIFNWLVSAVVGTGVHHVHAKDENVAQLVVCAQPAAPQLGPGFDGGVSVRRLDRGFVVSAKQRFEDL